MALQIKAFSNCHDAFIVWRSPAQIGDCIGLEFWRIQESCKPLTSSEGKQPYGCRHVNETCTHRREWKCCRLLFARNANSIASDQLGCRIGRS